MTKRIQITQDKETLVDDDVFEWAQDDKWRLDCHGRVVNTHKVYLHRLVLPVRKGFVVDHINGNPLDNRIENLRAATMQQNNQNRCIRKDSNQKYKGIYLERGKYWRAKIQGKSIGYFETEEEAAKAYDAMAKNLFGIFARLNFK